MQVFLQQKVSANRIIACNNLSREILFRLGLSYRNPPIFDTSQASYFLRVDLPRVDVSFLVHSIRINYSGNYNFFIISFF